MGRNIPQSTALLRGGFRKDFINPEAAWPQISLLAEKTAAAGFVLRERLAIYPEFLSRPEFVDAHVQSSLQKLRGEDGYA